MFVVKVMKSEKNVNKYKELNGKYAAENDRYAKLNEVNVQNVEIFCVFVYFALRSFCCRISPTKLMTSKGKFLDSPI